MKSLLKRIIRKIKKRILPQDEASFRKREARKKGLFLRFKRQPFVYTIKGIKSKFYLPLYRTDYIQQNIIAKDNYYEADNLNYICKEWQHGVVGESLKNGLVLDIGANIGNHTLYFCQECDAEFVHCFEPIASTRKMLKKNIEINNLSNRVAIHQEAIGAQTGRAKVASYDESNIGSTALVTENAGEIPIIRIDDMAFNKEISLIKIDVEGFELQVLKGGMKTISQNTPYIMIEIRDDFLVEIQSLLSPLNYKFEHLSGINYFLYLQNEL